MSSTSKSSRPFVAIIAMLCIGVGLSVALAPAVQAQAGLSTGSVQGAILDPHGATVGGAKVTIRNKATDAKISPVVTPAGEYNSGPLSPGDYVVRIEAAGFKAVEKTVTVQVGNITPGSVTLEVGSASTVITVEGTAVSVNTEQAAIQGVVTSQQIENLPINGRNFLDLAQLEPGVHTKYAGKF